MTAPAGSGYPPGMASFDVTWNDDRGQQTVEADDVVRDDGGYEFWRDGEVFLRAKAGEIREVVPQDDV